MPRTARNGSIQPSVRWWCCVRPILLPLDDLLAVNQRRGVALGFGCCLRRYGVSNLKALLLGAKAPVRSFNGFVRIDVKYLSQMPNHGQRSDLFTTTDRPTR